MKKTHAKLLSLALAVVMLLSMTACGNKDKTPDPSTDTQPPAQAAEQTPSSETTQPAESTVPSETPIKLDGEISLVAGNSTGGWFSIATALADKANEYFEGYPIVATTGGGTGNPQTVSVGEAQVGMTYGVFLTMAEKGAAPYSSVMTNLRAIAGLETTAVYFICDSSLGYTTLGELVNSGAANIALGSVDAGAASYAVQDLVMQKYGKNSFSELQSKGSMYMSDASSLYEAYSDGHFNVMCTMKAVPDSSTIDLLNNRSSTILTIEDDMRKALIDEYGWTEVVIPAGTYAGQENDVYTVGIKTVLMCRDDVPNEVSYYIAKTLYEQKDYFDTVQASWQKFSKDDFATGCSIQFHPGAEQYWKEVGLL